MLSEPMPRYIGSLDVVRAVAVLLVLFTHVPAYLMSEGVLLARAYLIPGYLGVDIFFALSGFLITRILIAERGRPQAWRRFWLRRSLRIFPIYFLLVAIVALVRPGPELPWALTYTANFYFPPAGEPSPLEHLWSLAVEEHFYLVWPFIVLLVRPRTARLLVLTLVAPLAIATAVWLVKSGVPQVHLVVGHITPTRMLTLGLGSLLAFGEGALHRHRVAYGLFGAGLIAGGYALAYFGALEPALRPLVVVWLLVGGALLSTGVTLLSIELNAVPWPRAFGLVAAPLRAIGRISYGLYLYHFPIFFAFYPRMAEGAHGHAWLALALALSVAAATLSYLFIERPILRYGARFRSPAHSAAT